MEVRAGYKETEVGIIPREWNVKAVHEIGQIKTGPFGTLLKASEYSGSHGVPLISVGEVGAGVFRVTDRTPRVPENVVRRLPQYVLRTGDIVFGRKGAVDRSALVSRAEDGWFLGSDGISIRPSSRCHPPYLAAQLQSQAVQSWLIQNAIGTTMPSLNQGILSRVQIPYASEAEQRAIAAALSDVDALLSGLERLIAKKRDLKKAAMQQLLTGQTRLSGFSGEWRVKRMGSVLRFQVGFPFASSFFNAAEQGLRLVKNRDLKSDDQIVHYTGAYHDAFLVRNGDVLIGMDGDFLPCRWKKGTALLNQRVGRVVPGAGLDRVFAYYYLIEPLKEIEAATSSTTVKHLSHGDVEGIDRPTPQIDEQAAIATVLSDMHAELSALEARRDKTRALKQAMMQELLTGRTRLV
ncbi:MAG: hypothetical protein CRU78_03305 [Candidatus Accumulibacter phosphatis]|uniref:Type I restriction modification DNA specificity domain-containing protein n=1 Tax=Candidatus Accumulibacter phosphatis TaxID=327160 RepID=A0A6A7RPZ6_9PROT|nr:hypothetical protein [Candidatus Accumulibacter phosphatis]